MHKKSIYLFLITIVLFLLPFSIYDKKDEVNATKLNENSIKYYQSTTCKISLFEFLLANNEASVKIDFNDHNYADINCFGKITGLDKVNDTYIVSIGVNPLVILLLQSSIWLTVISLVRKKNNKNYLSYISTLPIALLFTYQQVSETRFYEKTNVLYNPIIIFHNFYLINIFIFYLLLAFILIDLLKGRFELLINYLPFIFLISGTFSGTNLNFYLFLFSLTGLSSIFKTSKFKITKFDFIYVLIAIIWLINTSENEYFFEVDKLRGFTSSSNNINSKIFWIIVFYLITKGLIYFVKTNFQNLDYKKLSFNFIYSSIFIVLLGFIGAKFTIINFFNFLIFGQNKRGMKEISSVAGNAWRGFLPSAELSGEFFGLSILIFLIYLFKHKNTFYCKEILLIVPVIYGLYRSNNFASVVSLTTLISIFYFRKYKISKKNFVLVLFGLTLIPIYLISKNYDFYASNLLYESARHQDFYSNLPARFNPTNSSSKPYYLVLDALENNNLGTILLEFDNNKIASTSFKFLYFLFTPKFNIPFLPNLVGVLSIIAYFINRSEMWGIFIAKYNPNLLESLFGNGPVQLSEYLFESKVRLDVPSILKNNMYLPHSSVLDILIFFGLIGVVIYITFMLKILFNSLKSGMFFYPSCFLFVNFLKSDSLMYLSMFVLSVIIFISLNLEKLNDK